MFITIKANKVTNANRIFPFLESQFHLNLLLMTFSYVSFIHTLSYSYEETQRHNEYTNWWWNRIHQSSRLTCLINIPTHILHYILLVHTFIHFWAFNHHTGCVCVFKELCPKIKGYKVCIINCWSIKASTAICWHFNLFLMHIEWIKDVLIIFAFRKCVCKPCRL